MVKLEAEVKGKEERAEVKIRRRMVKLKVWRVVEKREELLKN